MKISGKFIITICSALAIFFITILIYTFSHINSVDVIEVSLVGTSSDNISEKVNHIYNLFMAQATAFLLTVSAIIFYVLYNKYKLQVLRYSDTKLILLTEENTDSELECILGNKSSAILGKFKTGNKEVCFIDKNNLNADKNIDKYAVINCVKNCWYVECIPLESSKMGMALKRGGKQCVYKLEVGYIYRLQPHDIIYLGTDRLRFQDNRNLKTN